MVPSMSGMCIPRSEGHGCISCFAMNEKIPFEMNITFLLISSYSYTSSGP